MNRGGGGVVSGFWRKLPPTLKTPQLAPAQQLHTDAYQYYYTFPSVAAPYPEHYGAGDAGKDGKRRKPKKKNKKKRVPVVATYRYVPPPLHIGRMVSRWWFCPIISWHSVFGESLGPVPEGLCFLVGASVLECFLPTFAPMPECETAVSP